MDYLEIFINGRHVMVAETCDGNWAVTIDHVYAGTWNSLELACYAACLELQLRRKAS